MSGFPYLPGVTLNLADLGLKIAPPPAGPKVTLLGYTSNTGVPINEPLTITNVGKAAAALFAVNNAGRTGAGELAIAVQEAVAAGAVNVEIVAIGHPTGTGIDYSLDPTSYSGQLSRYNDLSGAYDTIKQTPLTVVHPVNAWLDATGQNFGKQLADFCHQSSKDVDNAVIGVLPVMSPLEWAYTYKTTITGAAGASSAITGEAGAITGIDQWAFALPSIGLVNEWAKYISQYESPLVTSLPTYFDNYLAGSETFEATFDPTSDTSSTTAVNPDYFVSWQATNTNGSAATDLKGNKVDAGRRIAVLAVPLITSTTSTKDLAVLHGASVASTTHNTNGAAAYAGMITSLAPQSAPTNKSMFNVKPSRPLSPKQANILTARRLTTMHNRANGFVVTSAVTGAHNVSKYVRSDFVRLTTIRIVDSVIDIIRTVSDKYIGEPNTAAARNALSNEIEKFLKNMRVAQALNDYQMFVSATPDQQVLGEATIDLTLVPAFELIKIDANISLAKKL